MKTLSDGFNVTSRSYYFLLEWNEKNNKEFIAEKFGKHRLCDLNKEEYMILWLNATKDEYIDMFNKINYNINKNNVLICNNCKTFWISPKDKCDECSCTTLTETHENNRNLARNNTNK